MRSTLGLLVIALLMASGPAAAATPIHVCGKVTAYFVSDIPSGGRIELDGKNYPIASSASFQRTRPLPTVQVGTSVCVDGMVDDSGRLLDFSVTAAASPSAATPSTLPSTTSATLPEAQQSSLTTTLLIGFAALLVVVIALLAIARRARL